MFGKQYRHHPEYLVQSFESLNSKYKKQAQLQLKYPALQRLYISFFGIPEIGFQIRSLFFVQIISQNIASERIKTILDAGCGIGSYTFLLNTIYPDAQITGGEIDTFKLQACRLLAQELGISNTTFSTLDLLKMKKRSAYDLIVIIDVLEHIKNYKLVLHNLSFALRKKGYLYIHVPQPDQKRIFRALSDWEHEDHVREGIRKKTLENFLEKNGFSIIDSRETFGNFGKFAWELNHMSLSKSFILSGILFPLLYLIAKLDTLWPNKNGLGIAILVQKK